MQWHLTPLRGNTAEFQNYVVRAWVGAKEDMGDIEPVTGQWWRDFDFVANLCVLQGVGEMQGAQTVPPGASGAIRDIGRHLNLKLIDLERWDAEKKTKRRVVIYRGR